MAGKEGSRSGSRNRRGGKSTAPKKKIEKQVVKKGRNAKKGGQTAASKGSSGRGRSKSPVPKKNAQKQKQQQNKKQQKSKVKNQKGGKPQPRKEKAVTAEDLDRGMDDYWANSKDKAVVEKRLDDDMDDYWAAKKEGVEDRTDAASEEKKADDKEAGEA